MTSEQRGVAIAMAAGIATTLLVLGLAIGRDATIAPMTLDLRLWTALRYDVFVLLWLAIAIGNVARLRFFSTPDIGGSGLGRATAPVRQAVAILQNTLEQAVLAIGAHMAVAASLERPATLLACLVALFGAGRLLFWIGYSRGAAGRAFGFAITFYPSVAALLLSAGTMLPA